MEIIGRVQTIVKTARQLDGNDKPEVGAICYLEIQFDCEHTRKMSLYTLAISVLTVATPAVVSVNGGMQ
jgi:hypothetical protein